MDSGSYVLLDLDEMSVSGDERDRVFRLNHKSAGMTATLKRSYLAAIVHALDGRRKVSTVFRWVGEVDLFIRTVNDGKKLNRISLRLFNDYAKSKNASQVKLLRSVLKYWMDRRYPGLTEDLRHYLVVSKPPKPRSTNEIQNSVERERPFSYKQVRAILRELDELYVNGEFSAQDNLLWRLIASEALRPSQIQLMRVGDATVLRNNRGDVKSVELAVPLVKQHATPARDYMTRVRLSDSVARAVVDHLQFLDEVSEGTIGDACPLICVGSTHWGQYTFVKRGISVVSRIDRSRTKLRLADGVLESSDLFTRRFKHTKLTHLAALGAPAPVLAKAGFQTSTASLGHYVNLTDEVFAAYEEQLSGTHEHIARSFKIKVIDRQDASKPIESHGVMDKDLTGDVGVCTAAPCGVLGSNGCYECSAFNAFRDGPHKQVLDHLLASRKQREDMGLAREVVERDDELIELVRRVIESIESDE